MKRIIVMAGCFLILAGFSEIRTQQVLRLQDALVIASENSPQIIQVKLNLDRVKQLLVAQEASLKSNFRFTLNPLAYTHDRAFNELYNTWNTQENLRSSGTFTVSQPIALTDGTFSVSNRFQFQNSYSEFTDREMNTFTNNLYFQFDQPLFTYNRTKLAMRELELDLENTQLSYNLQMLNLERQVASSFYQVYQQQMRLEIAWEEYQNQLASFEIIKNKVEGGLSALEEL